MRKLTAAIACRNTGTRLYGKPLQNLDIANNVTILNNLISCLLKNDAIDEIVLGISDGIDNKNFIEFAKLHNLNYIIGDEIDVLSRLISCGDISHATDIFRVTSESPFPYYNMIEPLWSKHCKNGNDATFLEEIIDGCGFEIIALDALKLSHKNGGTKHRSELCTLYLRENKKSFKIEKFLPPKELIRKDIRLTVDYPEDLIVCRSVYEKFKHKAPFIPLIEVVEYLDKNKFLKNLILPFCEDGYSTMYL